MPEMPVKFPFIGIDKVSPSIGRMERRVKRFGDKSESVFRRMKSDALSVRSIMGGILGARVVGAGFGVIHNQVRTVTDALIEFDHAAVKASSRYGFDRNSDQFYSLAKAARHTGAVTRFTAAESAKAIDVFARSGVGLNDAIKLLLPTAKLAMAADFGIAESAENAASALAVFGKEADSFGKISDILAFTANKTKTDFAELFETVKKGGGILREAGAGASTFSAVARAMGDFKIIGEHAGTQIQTGLTRMLVGGKGAVKARRAINLDKFVADRKGNFRDIIDIIEYMEKKYENMSQKKKVESMRKIFGLHSLQGMLAVFKTGSKTLRKYRQEAEGSLGYVEDVSGKMGLSYENKLKEIQSAVVEVGFTIVDSFGKDIPVALQSAIDSIRGLDTGKIKNDIKWAKETASDVVGTIKAVYPIMKSIAIIWAGFKFRNAMSIMLGTFGDLRDRSRDFRRNINGVNRSLDKTSRKLELIGGGARGKGFGVYTQPILGGGPSQTVSPSAMGKNKRGFGSKVGGAVPGFLASAPVIIAGVEAWISVYDTLTEDVRNRVNAYWKSAEEKMFRVGSWGKLEQVYESRRKKGGKEKILGEIENINEAYDAVRKSSESFTVIDKISDGFKSLFFDIEPRMIQLKNSASELAAKKSYLVEAYESSVRYEELMKNKTPYVIHSAETENKRVLDMINAIERNMDKKQKLEVETTVKFEGNVPAGTTAKSKAKRSPNIDVSKLGKNAA